VGRMSCKAKDQGLGLPIRRLLIGAMLFCALSGCNLNPAANLASTRSLPGGTGNASTSSPAEPYPGNYPILSQLTAQAQIQVLNAQYNANPNTALTASDIQRLQSAGLLVKGDEATLVQLTHSQ
jgi:hypothetical protein